MMMSSNNGNNHETGSSTKSASFSIDDLESMSQSSNVSHTSNGSRYTGYSQSATFSGTGANNAKRRGKAFNDDDDDDGTATMLATKESRDLVKLRFFLITVLFWVTVGCGLTVWVYFTETQRDEFEDGFASTSSSDLDAFRRSFRSAIDAVEAFSIVVLSSGAVSSYSSSSPPVASAAVENLRRTANAVAIKSYVVNETQEEASLSVAWEHRGDNDDEEAIVWPRRDDVDAAWDSLQEQELDDAGHGAAAVLSGVRYIRSSRKNDEIVVDEPVGDIYYPIIAAEEYDSIEEGVANNTSTLNGMLSVTFRWKDLLREMITTSGVYDDRHEGLFVVVENTCNQSFTYNMTSSDHHHDHSSGGVAIYLGEGDLHDSKFNKLKQTLNLTRELAEEVSDVSGIGGGSTIGEGGCHYSIHTYPSAEMLKCYNMENPSPSSFTAVAVVIFIFTALVFVVYDCLVERRQRKVYSSAVKNNAIVSSLFPKQVRDRLYKSNDVKAKSSGNDALNKTYHHPSNNRRGSSLAISPSKGVESRELKSSGSEDNAVGADAPIADLFANCTVLFADIAGFTSWSSERSPSQVFVLLETIYGAFDKIADRRGVFKVETIGDCYLAVTGLPNPMKDHALVMAKFARECRDQMNQLTKHLDVTLGPGTSDLSLRFGLHSGPVTAGVLRGQKSRFQLFGDTVNTAARMESNGLRNRIHISEDTANLIKEGGKEHWLTPRDETIQAKGKGELTTFWVFEKKVSMTDRRRSSNCGSTVVSTSETSQSSSSSLVGPSPTVVVPSGAINYDRRRRLIDWNVDLFAGSIRKILARRQIVGVNNQIGSDPKFLFKSSDGIVKKTGSMVLDEVAEIIELPMFDSASSVKGNPQSIEIGKDVMLQLKKYIFTISTQYNDNAFHNFEHASHVAMSVAKLLTRIVAPTDIESSLSTMNEIPASSLHDHTYGVASDPLIELACVYSALIHDVDHQGVPNTVLVEEEADVAKKYKNRSVAEQNSVDIAWSLFLEPQFRLLREAICPTDEELHRFRQLIVNLVMATDIMDKELKQLRNNRWEKAFSSTSSVENGNYDDSDSERDQINRKATIVLEHLIQASDVSHTMQHWHVYRKWNERLFQEMYTAFLNGRSNVDPTENWYKGEIGFFDFYIIPLAKKLSDCGVFGVSSDEYLSYALRNRKEWEERGESIVAEYKEKFNP